MNPTAELTLKPGDLFRRTKPYDAYVLNHEQLQNAPKVLPGLVRQNSHFMVTPEDVLVFVIGELRFGPDTGHADIVFMHPDRGVCLMPGADTSRIEKVEHDTV